ISGIVAAALGKSKKSPGGKLSSEAGAKGLLRKALILVVVLLAYLLDWFVNEGNAMFSAAACWFYISNESISLLENLAIAGVPVPKKIIGMFERIAIDEESGAGNATGKPEPSAIAQAGENAPSDNAQYASAPPANAPSANASSPAQAAPQGQSNGQNG
ncbi:MAG: phage holin family protein, partial [Clostridia bacterium]